MGTPAFQIEPLNGEKPAGFGPIGGNWAGRTRFAGTSDESYRKRRYPVPPKDFDPRYNCAAHPDLWSETPLLGNEPVEIVGATPEREFRFKLPRYEPLFRVTKLGKQTEHTAHLDTFLIDIEEPRYRVVELCWRLAVRLPKKSAQLQKVAIHNNVPIDRELAKQLFEDLKTFQRGRCHPRPLTEGRAHDA